MRGLNKIRITGGEPLLRDDLDRFISMIHNYSSRYRSSKSTNKWVSYLIQWAERVKEGWNLQKGFKNNPHLRIGLKALESKPPLKICPGKDGFKIRRFPQGVIRILGP